MSVFPESLLNNLFLEVRFWNDIVETTQDMLRRPHMPLNERAELLRALHVAVERLVVSINRFSARMQQLANTMVHGN